MDAPFVPVGDGLRVALKVTPSAGHDRIGEVAAEADGCMWLKVAVTAPPEGGKANKAAIALLAKAWRVPRSAITVVAGATARRKTLHVAGDAEVLARDLRAWLEARGG